MASHEEMEAAWNSVLTERNELRAEVVRLRETLDNIPIWCRRRAEEYRKRGTRPDLVAAQEAENIAIKVERARAALAGKDGE